MLDRSSLAVLAAASLLAACGSSDVGEYAEAEAALSCGHAPTPVVFDTDMDFDDAAALALLCREHQRGNVELLAVTVDNDGAGLPGNAIRHARCVLEACGLSDVPVADGSPTGVHAAPPELAFAVDAILEGALAGCTAGTEPAAVSAPELLAEAISASDHDVVVITTGPLSNLAAALSLPGHKHLAKRIDAVYSMAGAFDVPGNLFGAAAVDFDGSQEVNAWIDPAAAQLVLDRLRPHTLHFVPLDATNFVPITQAFVDQLGAAADTPEAQLVHGIVTQPIAAFAVSLGLFSWWDPLAVVAAVRDDDVVDFDKARVAVVQEGVQSGRTKETKHGAKVKIGKSADAPAFEALFLEGLGSGD